MRTEKVKLLSTLFYVYCKLGTSWYTYKVLTTSQLQHSKTRKRHYICYTFRRKFIDNAGRKTDRSRCWGAPSEVQYGGIEIHKVFRQILKAAMSSHRVH